MIFISLGLILGAEALAACKKCTFESLELAQDPASRFENAQIKGFAWCSRRLKCINGHKRMQKMYRYTESGHTDKKCRPDLNLDFSVRLNASGFIGSDSHEISIVTWSFYSYLHHLANAGDEKLRRGKGRGSYSDTEEFHV